MINTTITKHLLSCIWGQLVYHIEALDPKGSVERRFVNVGDAFYVSGDPHDPSAAKNSPSHCHESRRHHSLYRSAIINQGDYENLGSPPVEYTVYGRLRIDYASMTVGFSASNRCPSH